MHTSLHATSYSLVMSGIRAPLINDIATKGGYNLRFPLALDIGPVPDCEWLFWWRISAGFYF